MRRIARLVLPLLLIVVGCAALSGCIYLPTFGLGSSGKDLTDVAGPANSARPLREGTATAADVVRLLGRPHYASEDGRRLGYEWRRTNGLVFGLCNGVDRDENILVVSFDEAGVLRKALLRQWRETPIGITQIRIHAGQWDNMAPVGDGWTPPATRPASRNTTATRPLPADVSRPPPDTK